MRFEQLVANMFCTWLLFRYIVYYILSLNCHDKTLNHTVSNQSKCITTHWTIATALTGVWHQSWFKWSQHYWHEANTICIRCICISSFTSLILSFLMFIVYRYLWQRIALVFAVFRMETPSLGNCLSKEVGWSSADGYIHRHTKFGTSFWMFLVQFLG